MKRIMLLAMLAATPALAQSWPNDTGISRDGFRGSIDAFDRFRAQDNPRLHGEEARDRVGGWLDGVRGFLADQYGKVGQRDPGATQFFNQRRDWEGDLLRRR